MSGVGLTISTDDLAAMDADVARLRDKLQSGELHLLMGAAVREVVREHFYELNADSAHHETARSLGAAQTGLYLKAADATHAPVQEGDDVAISINQEAIAQRYFGGDIEAKPGSLLTLPARAEAYGHRAREFDNLKLIVFRSLDLAALVDKNDEEHEGLVYYWLVSHVHQEPDPTVLPTDEEMTEAATQAASDYAELLLEREAA